MARQKDSRSPGLRAAERAKSEIRGDSGGGGANLTQVHIYCWTLGGNGGTDLVQGRPNGRSHLTASASLGGDRPVLGQDRVL